jgi:hypothetical protein
MSNPGENINTPEEYVKLTWESVETPEEASLVISREKKDVYLIKLYIDMSGKNGFIYFIMAEGTRKIITMYSIFGTSGILRKINPFENFDGMILDLEKAIRGGGIEDTLSERIGRAIFRSLPHEKIIEVISQIELKQTKEFVTYMEDAVKQETSVKTLRSTLDIEKMNSLDFFDKNKLKSTYPEVRNPFIPDSVETEKDPNVENVESPLDIFNGTLQEIFKGFSRVVSCNVGISPLNGMEFAKLREGQPIFLNLPVATSEEQSIARDLGGIDDKGKFKPIIGKFFKILTSPKKEFHILAIGTNGVVLHAIEKNPVKISVPSDDDLTEETHKSNTLLYFIFVGLILLIGVLLSSLIKK